MSTTESLAAVSAKNCVVHPLVLLSIQDHFHRVAHNTKKRVVGILLGQDNGPQGYNIANSFAGELYREWRGDEGMTGEPSLGEKTSR
jgi:26S proteasome regulatory subunit N8